MIKVKNNFIGTTIDAAKVYLHDNWDKGVVCPCCNQLVKRYIRPMHAQMVRTLINLYKLNKDKPGYYHDLEILGGMKVTAMGDFSKFVSWGLIVQRENEGNERGRTSGFWTITQKGEDFVENKITLPSHVIIYNNETLGFTGEFIKISDVLGTKFDYKELMGVYYWDPMAEPAQQSLI